MSRSELRVMLVIHGLAVGGAEAMVFGLACELKKCGIPVVVVSLRDAREAFAVKLRERGVSVVALDKRKGPDARVIPALIKAIRAFSPSVVHTHLPVLEYVLPALGLCEGDVRVVHTIHSLAQKETSSRIIKWVNRRGFRTGVVPVALTEEVQRSICDVYDVPAHAVPVIRNGVVLAPYRRAYEEKRASKTFRLLHVARLQNVKNQRLLLETMKEVGRRTAKSTSLTIVGDGPLRDELVGYAVDLGIADRVHFVGQHMSTAAYYGNADLFLLTSRYEGLPMSAIEAMAAGLPVLATRVGGLPDLVDSGENGYLEEPDAQALAKRVIELMENDRLSMRMSRAALETSTLYSSDLMKDSYVELYRTHAR